MHAGDEDVEPTIAVEVEHFRPHGTPGSLREVFRGRVEKPLSPPIEPEVIPTLHVQDIEVRKPVVVHVERRGVAAPAEIHQPDLAAHNLDPVAAQLVVENARFGALGMEMPNERVAKRDIVATRPTRIAAVQATGGKE